MSGRDERYDGCKLCYFYERCKIAGTKCDKWLHWEYKGGKRVGIMDSFRVDDCGLPTYTDGRI